MLAVHLEVEWVPLHHAELTALPAAPYAAASTGPEAG